MSLPIASLPGSALRSALLAACLVLLAPLCGAHDDREPREPRERSENSGREERDTRGPDTRREGGEDRVADERDRAESSGNSGKSSNDLREHGGKGGSDGKGSGRDAAGRGPRLEFERDSQGHERLRAELLLIANEHDVAQVRAAGFTIIEQQALSAADEVLARVRVRSGLSVERALRQLQALVPAADVAPHHLFRPAGGAADVAPLVSQATDLQPDAPELGIVDTGIATATPALSRALKESRSFAPGGYVPRTHGTVVGDVAARAGASLISTDVFGLDVKNELAAPTASIVAALDWLVARRIRVLNISIEGPDNLVLAHEIRRALAAGVMIVAAAGNDGPAAPPAYPAAYPGVIAVTAVDEQDRVYRRANRGAYITFAARGVNVPSPLEPPAPRSFSGTSFAAPVVAAVLLQRRTLYPHEAGSESLAALRRASRDLGAPGRDEIFGFGEVAQPLRAGAR